jgi:hypothetical protein
MSSLFISGFTTKIVYAFLIYLTCAPSPNYVNVVIIYDINTYVHTYVCPVQMMLLL